MKAGKKQVLGTLKADSFTKIAQYEVGSSDGYTKLLTHFDGNDGAKEWVDSGNTGHIISIDNASPVITTAYRKVSNGSTYFTGTPGGHGARLTAPDSPDWELGTGDLTIEYWVRFNGDNLYDPWIVGQYTSGTTFWTFGPSGNGSVIRNPGFSCYNANVLVVSAYPTVTYNFTLNIWYNIAVVRTSGVWKIYINGTRVATTYTDGTIPDFSGNLYIGDNTTQLDKWFGGYLDEVRLSNVARYSGDYIPQSTPFVSDANTKLLLHMEPTDVCGNTATFVGTAQIDTAQSKFGGASLLLDGNSDYVTVADSPDWDLGTGNVTIDFWVRWNVLPGLNDTDYFVSHNLNSGNEAGEWYLHLNHDPGGNYYLQAYIRDASSWQIHSVQWSTPTTGAWYHIAWIRSNGTGYWYVDGAQVGSTASMNYTMTMSSACLLGIGVEHTDGTPTQFIDGYIDELRIQKGVATVPPAGGPTSAYTTTATPPATQLDFTGLDGNTDEEYQLILRPAYGSTSETHRVRINNDSGANYGQQFLYGNNTTIGAARITTDTGLWFSSTGAITQGLAKMLLYAKSGYIRTALIEWARDISGTTVTEVGVVGESWNNTADNITSLQVVSSVSLGIANGSSIELYSKKAST